MKDTTQDYIARYILLLLQSSKYKVGDKLPSEKALAIKFNCNRHTVRSALLNFKINKIIKSINGSGNIVINSFSNMFLMRNLISSNFINIKRIKKEDMPLSMVNFVTYSDNIFMEEFLHRNKLVAKSYIVISKKIDGKIDLEHPVFKLLALNGYCVSSVEEDLAIIGKSKYTDWNFSLIGRMKQKLLDNQGEPLAYILTEFNLKNYKKKSFLKI